MEQIQQFLPFILIFIVFYLFIILPQMRKQKKEKAFASSLKRGDRVITKSGMHGKVLDLNNDGTCVIEIGAGKVKMEQSAISMEMSSKLNAPPAKKK
ncbi:preprotein translocase subunit YajC [Croceiramulus getboli]|nr:preprotein translocase subunit YajC [Flavobacteriaceae bacterium YJPT1-3]